MGAGSTMSAAEHLGPQWQVVHHEGLHPYGGNWSTVHTQSGEQIGHMRFRTGDDPFVPEPGHTSVEYVHVDPEYRGQGAARALYRGVHERTGVPFIHDRDDMTPEAKKTVGRLAAENPGAHRVISYAPGGFPRVAPKAYPARRR